MDKIKEKTWKEELQERLKNLEKMKKNHEQDVMELTFVIDGLTNQIEEM